MKPRQRYPTAHRRWVEGKVPLATILVGPPPPVAELQATAALHADDVVHAVGVGGLAAALEPRPGGHSTVLVLFDLVEPHYTALDAIRALRATQGVRLVCSSATVPHDAWTQVIPHQVECRLTPKELLLFVQQGLGGALGVTAKELLDRVGWDVEAAAQAMARVLAQVEHPNLGDVLQLVEPDPELHFVAALVQCDLRRARELVPRVTKLDHVLGELEHKLMQLWAVGEIRPVARLSHPRDLSSHLGMEPETIKALAPLVRLYSRQKIAQRFAALAAVDQELRRGAPITGLLSALCATW